jgi:TonB family protein
MRSSESCPVRDSASRDRVIDTPPQALAPIDLRLSAQDRARLKGEKTAVEYVVDERGAVVPCSVRIIVRSAPGLENAALSAIRAAQFTPPIVNGQPAPVFQQRTFEVY